MAMAMEPESPPQLIDIDSDIDIDIVFQAPLASSELVPLVEEIPEEFQVPATLISRDGLGITRPGNILRKSSYLAKLITEMYHKRPGEEIIIKLRHISFNTLSFIIARLERKMNLNVLIDFRNESALWDVVDNAYRFNMSELFGYCWPIWMRKHVFIPQHIIGVWNAARQFGVVECFFDVLVDKFDMLDDELIARFSRDQFIQFYDYVKAEKWMISGERLNEFALKWICSAFNSEKYFD